MNRRETAIRSDIIGTLIGEFAGSVYYADARPIIGRAGSFGSKRYSYRVVGSTNDVAAELARAGAPEGTLVTAETQTMGQGRLDRVWQSPEGKGLWFSLILRPAVETACASQVTLMAAVALTEAINSFTGLRSGIKWPNDLLINGKKFCGILTEMRTSQEGDIDYIILGIGLNVNLDENDFNRELRPTATSLSMELGRSVDRLALLQRILFCLEVWHERWQREGFYTVRKAWKKRNVTLGRQVHVNSIDEEYDGRAIDIAPDGSLLVLNRTGQLQTLNAGEVSLKRAV